MNIKEIKKENWVNLKNKNIFKKYSKRDIGEIVYNSYRNQKKYNNGKVNKELEKRYNELNQMLRPVELITSIYYIKNGLLENRKNSEDYNDFLVIKSRNKIELLLDITTGEDLSYNGNYCIIQDKKICKTKVLYVHDRYVKQNRTEIGKINKVLFYKNIDLCDSSENKKIAYSNIIEIIDFNENRIFIDINNNNIYLNNNSYFLRRYAGTKEILLFKNGYPNQFGFKNFINFKNDFLNLISEYVE